MENETTKEEGVKPETEKETEKKSEVKEIDPEVRKLKAAIDRLTAENAEKKRELQARMSEQEKAEVERLEKEKALNEELENYRKKERLATSKAGFLASGMDEATSSKASESWINGDFDGFVETLKAFITEHDKAINAANIKNMARPPIGGNAQLTEKDFLKMSYAERARLYEENPDEYKELSKKR